MCSNPVLHHFCGWDSIADCHNHCNFLPMVEGESTFNDLLTFTLLYCTWDIVGASRLAWQRYHIQNGGEDSYECLKMWLIITCPNYWLVEKLDNKNEWSHPYIRSSMHDSAVMEIVGEAEASYSMIDHHLHLRLRSEDSCIKYHSKQHIEFWWYKHKKGLNA